MPTPGTVYNTRTSNSRTVGIRTTPNKSLGQLDEYGKMISSLPPWKPHPERQWELDTSNISTPDKKTSATHQGKMAVSVIQEAGRKTCTAATSAATRQASSTTATRNTPAATSQASHTTVTRNTPAATRQASRKISTSAAHNSPAATRQATYTATTRNTPAAATQANHTAVTLGAASKRAVTVATRRTHRMSVGGCSSTERRDEETKNGKPTREGRLEVASVIKQLIKTKPAKEGSLQVTSVIKRQKTKPAEEGRLEVVSVTKERPKTKSRNAEIHVPLNRLPPTAREGMERRKRARDDDGTVSDFLRSRGLAVKKPRIVLHRLNIH